MERPAGAVPSVRQHVLRGDRGADFDPDRFEARADPAGRRSAAIGALIAANIRKLGFRVEDVRLIVNSHTHYDHAGGIAALQRASGALVAASPASALALQRGGPTADDPQFAFGVERNGFPAMRDVRVVTDGETLRAGDLRSRRASRPATRRAARPGRGARAKGQRCLDIVYADSLNAVSAPGFRFTGAKTHRDVDAFSAASRDRRTALRRVADAASGVLRHGNEAAKAASTPNENPFVDPQGCKAYARRRETEAGNSALADERR